jgi:hypothetical protein
MTLKQFLKAIPGLVVVAKKVASMAGWNDSERGRSSLNILKTFPLYRPNSSGDYQSRSDITIKTINGLLGSFEFFLETLDRSFNPQDPDLKSPQKFSLEHDAQIAADDLKRLFDCFGSDKATDHDYHFIYGAILKKRTEINSILEIGLGTNNTDVVSNMGVRGKPGASLRAFRDFCPNAAIYGADIDSRVLFYEQRIETYQVDQTSRSSIAELQHKIPGKVDLVIDDGLHSPDANINTLALGINLVKFGGWIVIEDIPWDAQSIWLLVMQIMRSYSWDCTLFKTRKCLLFAANKVLR